MPTEHDAVKLEVAVYPDGATLVSVPPIERTKLVPVLESAAVAVRRVADNAVRDLEPVACGECGQDVAGIRAAPDGSATLQPCGHTTG